MSKFYRESRTWSFSYRFITDTLTRRPKCTTVSTFHFHSRTAVPAGRMSNDNTSIHDYLKDIFRFKDTSISNWIVETRVKTLCDTYGSLSRVEKHDFLSELAQRYTVDHPNIRNLAEKLARIEPENKSQMIITERSLKNALTPDYQWLFILMGRLEFGVKFLVDLRTDVLELQSDTVEPEKTLIIQQLSLTLHDLLLMWFSVGFFHLERITWRSSCEMLQKISDYEAIHPMKNWLDLKRRVGPYRRCFVFTHPSMPREPLVVLHTALCDLIPESYSGIEEAEKRIISKTGGSATDENKREIKAAIFYSIASTQKGLKGIDLGNYMIKEVAREMLREFPTIDQLSSLSPIPKFRIWFLDRLKKDSTIIFTRDEREALEENFQSKDIEMGLKKLFNNSLWTNNMKIVEILKDPLTRQCAWYLYKEKHRNNALNSVAHFHLRNGAVMWRINWMADPSPRGADNSCGLMVNYRYIPNETERNSQNYIERNEIKASESVMRFVGQATLALKR